MTAAGGVARDLLIAACAVSAGVHAGLAPAHLRESWPAGAAFLAAAALLAAAVVSLTLWPDAAWPQGLAAVLFAGALAGWALAVTAGLPLVHPEPEPVDALAATTKTVELGGLLLAVGTWRP